MDNKDINPTNIFLQSACIHRLKQLETFYRNPSHFYHNGDKKELQLIKLLINECTKKKCEIGEYNLFGKCLPG